MRVYLGLGSLGMGKDDEAWEELMELPSYSRAWSRCG